MPGEMVAIVITTTVLAAGVIIIGLIVFAVNRTTRLRHEERLAVIKSGRDVPLDWDRPARPKGRSMFWGIIFTGFGAGLQIIQGFDFFADMFRGRLFRYNDAFDYFGGMLFLGIGVALMYYHRNYQKQNGNGVETHGRPAVLNVEAKIERESPHTGEGI